MLCQRGISFTGPAAKLSLAVSNSKGAGKSGEPTSEKAEDEEAPDELIEDLVPHLHCNHPHFNPPPCNILQQEYIHPIEYLIRNSMATCGLGPWPQFNARPAQPSLTIYIYSPCLFLEIVGEVKCNATALLISKQQQLQYKSQEAEQGQRTMPPDSELRSKT